MKNHRGGFPHPASRGLDPAARQEQQKAKTEKIRTLLASSAKRPPPSPQLERPGLSKPTRPRFSIRAKPSDWLTADAGGPIIDAIFESVRDGVHRAILTWPEPPGGAFVAACIALREARCNGRLSHATFGYWPWRDGSTWAARLVLVNPNDIAKAARDAINDPKGRDWKLASLAHGSLEMIEIRLRDLDPKLADATRVLSEEAIVVRSPTLLETTVVFDPRRSRGEAPYQPASETILRRVRRHTLLTEKNAGLTDHFGLAGDPGTTPFAMFGLPAAKRPEELARYVRSDRMTQLGLDAVIVDLTRAGRSELPDQWEPHLEAVLRSLDDTPGRRPGAIVVADDASTFRRATRVMKATAGARHPKSRIVELGVYLDHRGLLGPAAVLQQTMHGIAFQADIKDASLAPLRERLVSLGRTLREDASSATKNVSRTLAFLRRAASLPMGLAEARRITDVLYDADDEVDATIRSMFRPRMVLGALRLAAEIDPGQASEITSLADAIDAKVVEWEAETPVSPKLSTLMDMAEWNAASTVLAFPDRRIAETYLASDRALTCACAVIDHRGIFELSPEAGIKRIIVVGPTTQAVRALLTTSLDPDLVLFLGDTAGSALLSAELAPLHRLAAFAPIASRVAALTEALRRGGTDETLDVAEAEFRMTVSDQEERIDLTQANEAYRGPVVEMRTRRGLLLRYRPTSDVLLLSPGETRPFEKINARDVEPGDSILVLRNDVRELIRRALAGSRKSISELGVYHRSIADIRARLPGLTVIDKARRILRDMQRDTPSVPDTEVHNIVRWLNAADAPMKIDGARQPGAARDWPRFRAFMLAAGIDEMLARTYWDAAITPSRSYRAQEGHLFNQRVVQFVLDPEAATAWASMRDVWQQVLEGVDAIEDVKILREDKRNG